MAPKPSIEIDGEFGGDPASLRIYAPEPDNDATIVICEEFGEGDTAAINLPADALEKLGHECLRLAAVARAFDAEKVVAS